MGTSVQFFRNVSAVTKCLGVFSSHMRVEAVLKSVRL